MEIKREKGGEKFKLNKDYYIAEADLEKLNMNLKKSKFLNILIEIYSIYDINYLLKLIKTKYGKEFSREILDLLINNKIKFNDLSFNDEIELYNFQKTLLSVSDKKFNFYKRQF